MKFSTTGLVCLVLLGFGLANTPEASAQISLRPGSSVEHPHDKPWDLSGRSLKGPRIRAIHDPAGTLPGSSTWLIQRDPFLAYAIGRDLNLRGWQLRDGVFGETGRYVGFTAPRVQGGGGGGMLPRDDASSCATCHNTPFGALGAGVTIPKDSGAGRNTPHSFGAGLIEMIGQRMRSDILAACDLDNDGQIEADEARGKTIQIKPIDGAPPIDLGACWDNNGDGFPDVDSIVRPWYLDSEGRWVAWATSLQTAGVVAWSPEVQVFGHGQLDGALASTLRGLFVAAADVHMGLQARDPTLIDDPDQDGIAGTSPVGTPQCVTVRPRDRGKLVSAAGVSKDDPDRDGFLEELTQGDVDLAEFFLFHIPPPFERPSPRAQKGRAIFNRIGCASCHVPDWQIDHDRRLFRLDLEADSHGKPKGTLVRTWKRDGAGALRPKGKAFKVQGVYSDFRRHDLGPNFHDLGFDGTVIKSFRTPPLWGVGSSAPYGHDGASLSLEDVIDRHGGDAHASAQAWDALGYEERTLLLTFLRSLVLYPINGLASDTNGDGAIEKEWRVKGRPTGGSERFDPELLATVPCAVEGPTQGFDGAAVFSQACTNVPQMYRTQLKARRDRDEDGFPDLRDDCPATPGYLDGCRAPDQYTGP